MSAGGVVGITLVATIESCGNEGDVTCIGAAGGVCMGGVYDMKYCYNRGRVSTLGAKNRKRELLDI